MGFRVTLGQPPVIAPRSPSLHDELEDLRSMSPRAIYRWAIVRGWSVEEAGNWAAWCSGIDLVEGETVPTTAWTLRAVGHALFLRWLAGTGQIGGPEDRSLSSAIWRSPAGSPPTS